MCVCVCVCVCVYVMCTFFKNQQLREQSNYSGASLIDEYIDTHTDRCIITPCEECVCLGEGGGGDHNRRMFFVHIAYILLVSSSGVGSIS